MAVEALFLLWVMLGWWANQMHRFATKQSKDALIGILDESVCFAVVGAWLKCGAPVDGFVLYKIISEMWCCFKESIFLKIKNKM